MPAAGKDTNQASPGLELAGHERAFLTGRDTVHRDRDMHPCQLLSHVPCLTCSPVSAGEEGVAATLEGMGSQVLILDELDSGVGGRLGTAVGQLLRSMVRGGPAAAASQILCVSHLPQASPRLPALAVLGVARTA